MSGRKRQIFLPIIIIILGAGGAFFLSNLKKPPEKKDEKTEVPVVNVQTVQLKPVQLQVGSYGVVEPKYETSIVPQVSGEVSYLSKKFVIGGFVQKGELLAQIDSSDYEAALLLAEANLADAQASLENEIAQAKVAKQQWSELSNSPTQLALRKPQLAKAKARVKAMGAEVQKAQRSLERTRIVAPYNAIIVERGVGLGGFVSSGGKPIAVLQNTEVAKVRLPVANSKLQYLHRDGEFALVELTADRAGQPHTWPAKIMRTEGVVDKKNRMTYLVAEITDPYGLSTEKAPLKYGTYVTASISGISVQNAIRIPRKLVENQNVAVLDSQEKLTLKTVTVLRYEDKDAIISSGLHQGDRIIVSALANRAEGEQLSLMKVKPKQSPNIDKSDTQLALQGE